MNNLRPIAQAVQSQGRGKDTQLIHMTPNEVQGLQALAKAHGGSLSINPSTGLPEAGFLDSMMPMLLGAGLAAATGGSSLMIGAGLGGLQYARTGSLEKGIMAGLGAYGGAGLGTSLMNAGATAGSEAMTNAAAEQAKQQAEQQTAAAANNTATREAAQIAAKGAGTNLLAQQTSAAAGNTFGANLSNMGTGLQQAFSSPSAFMQSYGGSGGDLAKYAGAAASGPLLEPPKQQQPEVDKVRFEYDYSPNRASKEDLAAQRSENPYGELTSFRPSYSDRREVNVGGMARGGIANLANGGDVGAPTGAVAPIGLKDRSEDSKSSAPKYTYDPKTQTYTKTVEELLEEASPKSAGTPVSRSGGESNFGADPDATNVNGLTTSEQGAVNLSAALAALGITDTSVHGEAAQAQANAGIANPSIGPNRDSGLGGPSSGDGFSGADSDNGFGPSSAGGMARGGALHFAEGDVVPDSRFYPEPTQTVVPNAIPTQTSQELAAAALQQQQLANQTSQFVAPNAMIPQQQTFGTPQGIASGYATDYTKATPASFQTGLAALQPARRDLPGGFSGYGDASLVRQPAVAANVDGTFPVAANVDGTFPVAPVIPGGRTDTALTQFTPDKIIAEAQTRTSEGDDFRDTLLDYARDNNYTNDQIDEILDLAPGSTVAYENKEALTDFMPEQIIAEAQTRTSEGDDFRDTLLDYGQDAKYTNDQMDIMLGLPSGSTVAYANKEALTDFMPEQIIAEAQTRTPEGGDVRDTLLSYGRENNYTNDQMDIMLGLPAGSTAGYATSVGKKKGGLLSLAEGGMARGGFVVPADVVSALGNGSSDAGLRKLYALLGDVKPIKGKGDGLSDSIPTSIDGKQPARVADGEAYVNPKTVAKIGGGDAKQGAKKLYAMMDKIRQQAHGKKTQQREVNARAVV